MVDGPSATREGVESRVKRATPRNQCQAWAWCKKAEKDPYAQLHFSMMPTACLLAAALVRIRPTKLSFPNNHMKNAQRRADNKCQVVVPIYSHWQWLSANVMTIGDSYIKYAHLLPAFLLPTLEILPFSCIVIYWNLLLWKYFLPTFLFWIFSALIFLLTIVHKFKFLVHFVNYKN